MFFLLSGSEAPVEAAAPAEGVVWLELEAGGCEASAGSGGGGALFCPAGLPPTSADRAGAAATRPKTPPVPAAHAA